jgi:hypothetical protein
MLDPAFTFSIFCLLPIITIIGNSFNVQSFTPDTHIAADKSAGAESILIWNNLTTQIGIKEKLSAPEFSRAYALVHISIYDSLLVASGDRFDENGRIYDNRSLSSLYVSSIAIAASSTLQYLFPNYTDEITELKSEQIRKLQVNDDNYSSLITEGGMIGSQVFRAVIDYAKTDNLMEKNNTIIAAKNDSCTWSGTSPVSPDAGYWRTFILKSGSEIQPRQPPLQM